MPEAAEMISEKHRESTFSTLVAIESKLPAAGAGARWKSAGSCLPAIGKTRIAMGLMGFFIGKRAKRSGGK
jgi:hypothetical protein